MGPRLERVGGRKRRFLRTGSLTDVDDVTDCGRSMYGSRRLDPFREDSGRMLRPQHLLLVLALHGSSRSPDAWSVGLISGEEHPLAEVQHVQQLEYGLICGEARWWVELDRSSGWTPFHIENVRAHFKTDDVIDEFGNYTITRWDREHQPCIANEPYEPGRPSKVRRVPLSAEAKDDD